jgi:hypothetical protein
MVRFSIFQRALVGSLDDGRRVNWKCWDISNLQTILFLENHIASIPIVRVNLYNDHML